MALFGFGKKKNTEEELAQCDCGGMCKPSDIAAKKAAEEAEKAAAEAPAEEATEAPAEEAPAAEAAAE